MPHFLTIKRSRNLLSSIFHFFVNSILAISTILLTVLTGNPTLGLIFVFLSKWRMFAVHPYYWLANIKSNLADLVIGASFVMLSLPSGGHTSDFLPVHGLLALGYIIWLTLLKPGTSTSATETQALVATFLGINTTTIFLSSNSAIFILATFLVAYSATRHLLIQSDDQKFTLINLSFATIVAEFSWLLRYWLIVYSFENTGIIVSQLAIASTLLVLCFSRIHSSIMRHDGKLKSNDALAPILFSATIIIIMLIWFSKPIFNI